MRTSVTKFAPKEASFRIRIAKRGIEQQRNGRKVGHRRKNKYETSEIQCGTAEQSGDRLGNSKVSGCKHKTVSGEANMPCHT
jgi:hypothetical protein